MKRKIEIKNVPICKYNHRTQFREKKENEKRNINSRNMKNK